MDPEGSFDGLEIVEQSALDHFMAVLQNAQKIAVEAEKNQPRKRRKSQKHDGKSKRTLQRRRKCKKDLAEKGFLSVFEFKEHVDKAKKKSCLEPLVANAPEGEQESEESTSKESDTEDLVPKRVFRRVGQVRRQVFLMHRVSWMRPVCNQRRGRGRNRSR
jgi:hypothetical protein